MRIMIKRLKYLSFLIVGLLMMTACKKEEGYGGKSTLYGKVYELNYNNSGQLTSEYYVQERRVYITFGNDDFYSDEVRTDYEGKFKFSYLYPGDYTVYAYSECSPIDPCDSDLKAVALEIKILNNGDVVYTSDIVVENW